MAERRTIGQILMSSGRLTDEDCRRALEYQRDHGGYFGEALLALGFVSQDELDWGLASQFDLPFIFPDADSIDPEAAALVSPEWALAHLTLPIMKTDEALTVVVESPIKTDAVDELHARTDLRIELALASASKIRELIRQVFARGTAAEENERPTPIHLTEAFAEALECGAPRFGISTRGHRSWAWWDDSGTVRRRPLEGLWEAELEKLLKPTPQEHVAGVDRAQWNGQLNREGMVTPVEVRYLADESGLEYLFRPVQERSILQDRFPLPSPGIMSEIRLLARSGAARFVVTATPDDLGHDILPHLPILLLDPSWRSIYINASEQEAAHEAFSLRIPLDPDKWATELETLRAFHFDVVTVDLTGNQDGWASTALDVASVAFLLWPMDVDRRPAYDAGIRWELHIERLAGSELEWTLEPLHS
ncbi:MAG: GspE/PulE/PilB domain-containing protein [Longimicrobiales bacterium]